MTSPHNPPNPFPGQPGGPASPYSAPGAAPVPQSGSPFPTPHASGSPVPPPQHPGPQGPGQAPAGHGPQSPLTTPGLPGQPPGPGPATQPPKKKSRLPLLVGTGVLVLALLSGLGYLLLTWTKTPEQRAEDAINDFMKNYAAGNGEKAKTYLDTDSGGDTSLLTDQVLKTAATKAPITDITITSTGGLTYRAAFKTGGKPATLPITAQVPTSRTDPVRLKATLPVLDLAKLRNLPVTVNGTTPKTTSPRVLPGGYTLTITNPNYTLEPDQAVITVSQSPSTTPEPKLSQDGEAVFRDKLRQAVAACLAEKTLAWTCGVNYRASGGYVPHEGTVARVAAAEEMAKIDQIKVRLDPTRPNLAQPDGELPRVKTSSPCDYNGAPHPPGCEPKDGVGPQLQTPKIDMTTSDLKVTWS